jgi:hypothetical protein
VVIRDDNYNYKNLSGYLISGFAKYNYCHTGYLLNLNPTIYSLESGTIDLSIPFTGTLSLPVTKVPYGTSYTSIQQVYDMLIGYGAYLKSQGFIFDEFNTDLNEIIDWKFTGKEFLYWSSQNWADGNLITLSPFAAYLKYFSLA